MEQSQLRSPRWSQVLTRPLAARVPRGWEAAVVGLVKGVHTAIFASMVGALSMLVWDGLRQQPGRRTLIAGALIVAEAAVYVSNDQVCPLTPLAEEIGAERGSVADIFLPDWMARRIPIIGTTALIAGVALNLRSWLRPQVTMARSQTWWCATTGR